MSNIGKPERETQNRVIALFRDELHYRYLGDRAELDKQIQGVFADAGEAIHRTSSGHDLMAQLSQVKPRLLCSLVHKFGEAVEDGVVLDLVYEARDIEQSFGS